MRTLKFVPSIHLFRVFLLLSGSSLQAAVVHDMWSAPSPALGRLVGEIDRSAFSPSHGHSNPSLSLDRNFRHTRWPCIIRGAAWSRRQGVESLPPHALDFIPLLKAAFAAEGLPQELAWVAEVESAWATNAVSRSGARGLYQFKPEAAKRFALLQETRDFRTEPEPSARAAARYLAQLYSQFGDWRLAIAAYNAGEGCVSRLLKSRRARSYDEIATYLPPQTQVYVIKVMSIVSIREATTLSALPGPRLSPSGN